MQQAQRECFDSLNWRRLPKNTHTHLLAPFCLQPQSPLCNGLFCSKVSVSYWFSLHRPSQWLKWLNQQACNPFTHNIYINIHTTDQKKISSTKKEKKADTSQPYKKKIKKKRYKIHFSLNAWVWFGYCRQHTESFSCVNKCTVTIIWLLFSYFYIKNDFLVIQEHIHTALCWKL